MGEAAEAGGSPHARKAIHDRPKAVAPFASDILLFI
jgi:hypothetical protein